MKMKQIDNFYTQKDKNMNFSLDSSRTADSISELYPLDTVPLKTELEIEQKKNIEYPSSNFDDNSFNIKIEQKTDNYSSDENKIKGQNQFFFFKLQISIALSLIYFSLFLISIPKRPMINGEDKNIKLLINNNNNKNINILLNNFKFFYEDKNETNNNLNKNMDKENNLDNMSLDNKRIENYFSGFLLEFKNDRIYIIRWLIGFLFFIIRCACFIFSDFEFSNKYLDKKKISLIQKFSCLFFPLWVFFYDINKCNIAYTKIKTEYINNKIIGFYVEIKKNVSMIDYVEGIIPTSFYFLISIINSGMEQKIKSYLGNKKKITKLV
jgi:hypothetical protein